MFVAFSFYNNVEGKRHEDFLGSLHVLCQLAACYFHTHGLSAFEHPVFSDFCTIVYTHCTKANTNCTEAFSTVRVA
jgi:hypothetical protein